jgi:hypothetical protein
VPDKRSQPRHPKGAPASQGGRFARAKRPEAGVSLSAEAPLSPERLSALAAALHPDEGAGVLRVLALSDPEAFAERALTLLDMAEEGPSEEAGPEELDAMAHPDQSAVVLFQVLDHPNCRPEVALRMLGPDYPVAVRAEAVSQGWPGAARRAAHDPHPYVRSQAIGAWDLDEASAEALRLDSGAHKARLLFG